MMTMEFRLIRRQDREQLGIDFTKIESPFFAASDVRNDLWCSAPRIFGLDDLIHSMGYSRRNVTGDVARRVLDTVERGDWLLVKANPFSPLSQDTSGKYRHITGKGWSGGFYSIAQPKELAPQPPAKPVEPLVSPQPEEPGFYI